MKKALLILALLLFSVSGAYSQGDTDYNATLKSLLDCSGALKIFKTAVGQILTNFKQQDTTVPGAFWVEIENEIGGTSLDELVDMLAPVYQRHLTKNDLLQMIEFYKSPVGKKYAEVTPIIEDESYQVGKDWGTKLAQKIIDKLKEKGYKGN